MGFTVEDYSEIVTDYECFESLNIPKFHPARDMQDTYYLENGQLLKSQTSAAQNAIYRKYRDRLIKDGTPIKAIFPGRCVSNPVRYPRFRASASVALQQAAFAIGVLRHI